MLRKFLALFSAREKPTITTVELPKTDREKLQRLISDFLPVIKQGIQRKINPDMSAHAQMTLLQLPKGLQAFCSGELNISTMKAYTDIARMTEYVAKGMDESHRTMLQSKGYANPLKEWGNLFHGFGMTAIHANTGAPAWSRITSC